MRILDHLTGPEGQAAIKSLSKTLSIPEASVTDALLAIVPEFSHAIERNTLNRGGLADIVASLGRVDASQPLAQTADLASPQAVGFGTGILEQFFGTKDQSRKVAARVADETGLPAELIKKMLPAAAGMTMAALARGSRAPLQQIIGKIPGLAATGPLGMPGASGGDSLPPQTPLPIPGNNLPDLQSPYDDLPDVVRRGGTRVPQGGPSGGGSDGGASPTSLDGAIRDILGNLLGFQNRGFLGWLFQVVLIPMLLRIVQSVIRRVLTGR